MTIWSWVYYGYRSFFNLIAVYAVFSTRSFTFGLKNTRQVYLKASVGHVPLPYTILRLEVCWNRCWLWERDSELWDKTLDLGNEYKPSHIFTIPLRTPPILILCDILCKKVLREMLEGSDWCLLKPQYLTQRHRIIFLAYYYYLI